MKIFFSFLWMFILLFSNYGQQNKTEHYFGAVFLEGKSLKKMKYLPTRGSFYPVNFSLRDHIASIGDQGQHATCVGWASTYNLLQILNFEKGNVFNNNYSAQFTFDVIKLPQDKECKSGTSNYSALALLKNIGALYDFDYPDYCSSNELNIDGLNRIFKKNNKDYLEYRIKAAKNRIGDFYDLGKNNFTSKVKELITKGIPILVGVDFFNSMGEVSFSWNGSKDESAGGHAMCIIGYNDTIEDGSFELLNSWGDKWGDNGCMWIRYKDMNNIIHEAFGIEKLEDKTEYISNSTYLEDFDIQLSFSDDARNYAVKKVENNKVFWEERQLYIPILHDNKELLVHFHPKHQSNQPFEIDVTSKTSGYLYLFRENVDNRIELIYPYDDSDDNTLAAGKHTHFPSPNSSKDFFYTPSYEEKNNSEYYESQKLLVLFSAVKLDRKNISQCISEKQSGIRDFTFDCFGPQLHYINSTIACDDYNRANIKLKDLSTSIIPIVVSLTRFPPPKWKFWLK